MARSNVPTGTLGDAVASAQQRVAASSEDRCVITSRAGIVLGVLDPPALANDDDARVGEAMQNDPPSVRTKAPPKQLNRVRLAWSDGHAPLISAA